MLTVNKKKNESRINFHIPTTNSNKIGRHVYFGPKAFYSILYLDSYVINIADQ